MDSTNVLSLERRERGGKNNQSLRHYVDFIVDGVPLRSLVPGGDVTPLCDEWVASFRRAAIEEFLLERPPRLPDGRVAVYVCGECGDEACGVISARVGREGDFIMWTDFVSCAYGYGDEEKRPRPGAFRFDAAQYRSAFEQLAF